MDALENNEPLHNLVPSILPRSPFALTFICGEAHLRSERRLGLVDTAHFVSYWILVSTDDAYTRLGPDLFPRIFYVERQL
jgi:hypothetical protein